jgi:AcrR family transcriptional regulator
VTRSYELKKRAERQQETRQRIVEAAVQLHGTKGPGRTTLSDVARLAGVQRHTLYRHFPTERDLFMACSGCFYERNPPPDPEPWRATADPAARLRRGLTELYAYYGQAQGMLTRVLRDAEYHPLTREIATLRGQWLGPVRETLAEVVPPGARARTMLGLALDFRVWSRLAADGLPAEAAAEAMTAAILAQ